MNFEQIFWRSVRIALLVQAVLTVLFILGAIINGTKKETIDNFHYGVYFSFLFLQFFPIILLAVLVILLILKALKRKNVKSER
jgi:uncharacterized membrane protein